MIGGKACHIMSASKSTHHDHFEREMSLEILGFVRVLTGLDRGDMSFTNHPTKRQKAALILDNNNNSDPKDPMLKCGKAVKL